MRRARLLRWTMLFGFFLACQAAGRNHYLLAQTRESASGDRMPLTTKSEKARTLFESAISKKGNYRINECLADLRAAVKEDEKFAEAWALLGHFTDNSAESAEAFGKARSLAPQTSAPEQLFIGWLSSISSNDMMGAIRNANDLLPQYPRDKYVLFLGADWFSDQGSIGRARDFFERVIQLDPQFTAAYNRLGYAYAFLGNYPKALETMQRYAALLPKDPNPQDSFADISMKAGKLNDALVHFRAALALDAKFAASLHGLGDTYMLLGDYAHAREEDAKAMANAANQRRAIWYQSSIAQTWVREKNFAKADAEFAAILERAHRENLHDAEATMLVQMSLYQRDPKSALELLEKADESLRQGKNLSPLERDEALSSILRWRAVRAVEAGNTVLAGECIEKLRAKFYASGNDVISANYHAALGAQLSSQKKYSEAIAHLEEDRSNPYSLRLLAAAYRGSGSANSAEAAEARLLNYYEPTMEQALVVVRERERTTQAAAQ
jgi:tetratricopeptide (TPR) repeat protein